MITRTLLLTLTLLLGATLQAFATSSASLVQEEGTKKRADFAHLNLDKKGLAIEGYDPVSYFKEGGSKPQKGKANISHKVAGVTYRFADKKHLELFKKDPAKYEPAYGGWCAYAMAKDDKVEVDPESYLIQNGKLMLFYKSFFNNTRKTWMKKPADYEKQASTNWTKIIKPKPKPKPTPK